MNRPRQSNAAAAKPLRVRGGRIIELKGGRGVVSVRHLTRHGRVASFASELGRQPRSFTEEREGAWRTRILQERTERMWCCGSRPSRTLHPWREPAETVRD